LPALRKLEGSKEPPSAVVWWGSRLGCGMVGQPSRLWYGGAAVSAVVWWGSRLGCQPTHVAQPPAVNPFATLSIQRHPPHLRPNPPARLSPFPDIRQLGFYRPAFRRYVGLFLPGDLTPESGGPVYLVWSRLWTSPVAHALRERATPALGYPSLLDHLISVWLNDLPDHSAD